MSDSLENMADMQSDVTQPVDGVAPNTEATIPPQDSDEGTELYIEAEGDQPEEPKNENVSSDADLHARWLKERDKRKKKEEQRKAEEERANRLEDEIAELKKTVVDVTRGPRPDPYDYASTEEFYAALDEWNGKITTPQGEQETQTQTKAQESQFASDEDEFYLYQKESELSKAIPTYDQEKAGLVDKFKQYGGGEQNIAQLTAIGRQKGVDVAKAFVGLNKNPSLVKRLADAYGSQNPFAIADVLVEAQNKVQTRQRKPIDAQPEPTIQHGGPIDNSQKAIQKARDAWVNASPDERLQKWNEYQAAKKVNK